MPKVVAGLTQYVAEKKHGDCDHPAFTPNIIATHGAVNIKRHTSVFGFFAGMPHPQGLQTLWRLPRSNAIAFPIRCYLIKFEELVTQPKWARRLHRVVRDIHPDLAAYKGFLRNRDAMAAWLSQYDDGAPTSPGWWPED